jgi:hypothetical protein
MTSPAVITVVCGGLALRNGPAAAPYCRERHSGTVAVGRNESDGMPQPSPFHSKPSKLS